jgi:hypothetical protein
MSKKSWVTAEELMAELQQDPEFKKQQTEREHAYEARMQRVRVAAEPVVHQLQSAGFAIHAVEELAPRYAPIPGPAIRILLSWIPRVQEEAVREMIVRALAATTEPFDGRPLAHAFESSNSESFRWAVGNTMALANPTGVEEWVVKAVANPNSGKARETLAIATARLAPPDVASRTLTPLLEEFPVSVAQAMALFGGPAEAALLEQRREHSKGWQRKEIDKALRALRRRSRE